MQRDHTPFILCTRRSLSLCYACTLRGNLGNQAEFQSLSHSSGVHPRKHTAVKPPCALVMCANAQEFKYVGVVLQSTLIAGFAACANA